MDDEGHTQRDIVIDIKRNILPGLDLVYSLQDCQAMSDTVDAHFLEFIVLKRDECLSYNTIFCGTHH